MPKNFGEKGFAPILLLIVLLVIGIAVGVYLVKQSQDPRSRAGGGISQPVVAETSFRITSFSESFPVGREIGVTVFVNSDFEQANLFAAKISFNKDLLEVTSIDTSSPFIKNWVEYRYDNTTGKISLIGGVPNPGIQTTPGQSGGMAVIFFKTLKEGSASINFDEDSAIYSNASNQNILTVKSGSSISIYGEEVNPPTPTITPTSGGLCNVDADCSSGKICQNNQCITLLIKGNGDGNNDGKIDLVDLSILLSNYNKSSNFPPGIDINGDGMINTFDFSGLLAILDSNGIIELPN